MKEKQERKRERQQEIEEWTKRERETAGHDPGWPRALGQAGTRRHQGRC